MRVVIVDDDPIALELLKDTLTDSGHEVHCAQDGNEALATLAGVQRAQAVDLDGDGDLDIVACALVATHNTETPLMPAVVWLEQTKPGVFERHVIEVGQPIHATLDAGDFDHDGDVDIVVGNFSWGGPVQGSVEIFENLRTHR